MAEKTKNNIEKETDGFIDKITSNWPRWIKISCGLLFVSISWFIPMMTLVMSYEHKNYNVEEIAEAVGREIVEGDSIKKTFEDKSTEDICNFENKNNWLGIKNFKIEQENIFKPLLSENFPEGRELFCNKEVGINFQVYFKFTPLSNKKVNTSINYGNLWRIIIGNGDYRQIRVQKNEEYPLKNDKQVDWVDIKDGKKWLRLNSRLSELESLRQVEVEIISKISKENAIQENITLKIAGIPKNEEMLKDFDEYSFKISLPKDCNDLKEKIGVGILGTEKDEIKVQFEEFKIEELKF